MIQKPRSRQIKAATLCLLLSCPTLYVHAENEPQETDATELFSLDPVVPETEVKQKSILSFLDKPHKSIESRFKRFVRATDEFFADEKVFYETSGSYLKLTGEAVYNDETGETGYNTDVKLKLILPATEQQMHLLLESDPTEEDEEIDKALQETPQEAVSEQSYFMGIGTTVGEEKSWQFKPSFGVKLRRPLDYYTRLRLTREVPINDGNFQFKQVFYWFNSSGWESDTSGEFNLPVSDNLLFRSTTGINRQQHPDDPAWPEDRYKVTLRQIFSLTHRISDRRAVSYQAAVYGLDYPTVHTSHYVLTTHYRQNLYRDFLFVDLIPQAYFYEAHDFEAEYLFTLRLEMIFKD